MRRFSLAILLLAVIGIGATEIRAQSLSRHWLYGFGAGTQQLYSDRKSTGYGIGVEGLGGYRFNDRFGATLSLGYATLPFKVSSLGGTGSVKTNLIYGNLLFDVELLNQGKFHPYLMLGAGGFNFQVQKSKRFNDGSGIAGLGFRWLVGPNVAVNANAGYHYTTGDDLDVLRKRGNDGFFSGRVGLTFLRGTSQYAPDEDLFSESAFRDDEDDSGDFQGRLSQLDRAPAQQSGGDMQEYIRLKSRVDELNQDIDGKEREISNLLTAVSETKQNVNQMQAAASAPTMDTGGSFSRTYEQALNGFYLKRYPEAIQMFTDLVNQYPTHSLVSSCYYWIGEAQFNLGNHAEAVNALNKVLQAPRSLKKDDALLVLGKAYVQLNRREEARQALNRLIQEHPGSEFVDKAEALLRQL